MANDDIVKVRLPREMGAWLRSQKAGISETVRRALVAELIEGGSESAE